MVHISEPPHFISSSIHCTRLPRAQANGLVASLETRSGSRVPWDQYNRPVVRGGEGLGLGDKKYSDPPQIMTDFALWGHCKAHTVVFDPFNDIYGLQEGYKGVDGTFTDRMRFDVMVMSCPKRRSSASIGLNIYGITPNG